MLKSQSQTLCSSYRKLMQNQSQTLSVVVVAIESYWKIKVKLSVVVVVVAMEGCWKVKVELFH